MIKSSNKSGNGFEWQTWLVIVAVYACWAMLILNYQALPSVAANVALVLVTSWFMSIQHELLHGHPTRSKWFNRLLGLPPLSVWYPYDIYRDSHLAHHRDELLTTPGIDPECNYVQAQDYPQLSAVQRATHWSLRTVFGRFLVGPGVTIVEVWADIFTGPRQRGMVAVRSWAQHLGLLVLLLWWVQVQSGITPLHYAFGIAYPALGLAMLRSFYEHRPAALPAHRIAINDAAWPWRLLYLNNNYHSVHHAYPGLAWYRIPAVWRAQRVEFLHGNGNFYTPGYTQLIWNHAFKPVDSPIHPGFDDGKRAANGP